MSLIITALASLTLAIHIGLIAFSIGFTVQKSRIYNFRNIEFVEKINRFFRKRYREICFLVAGMATSGSLYMSQILDWTPCLLCWYQRILIYPLVILFGLSAFLRKDDVGIYALPFIALGSVISSYHVLIQNFDFLAGSGCEVGDIACSSIHMLEFGYISIPVMALTSLTVIGLFTWLYSPEID